MDNHSSKIGTGGLERIFTSQRAGSTSWLAKHNVNNVSYKNNLTNNVSNVGSEQSKLLEQLLASYEDKPQGIAQIIAKELGDLQNLPFHIKTAKLNPSKLLFESLAITLDAQRQGRVRTTLAKYYVGVLKRKAGKWKL